MTPAMRLAPRPPTQRAHLVLDLETIVDRNLPARPKKKNGESSFPPPSHCEIAVMGAALLDARGHTKRIWIVGEERCARERDILTAFVTFLATQLALGVAITIVGWNSRGFDLPVIIARCLKYGLAFPWYYQQRDVRYRYSPEGHLDLMDLLSDHGAARMYGLDVAARLIGLPGKIDPLGASVCALVARGKIDDVRSYCLGDVAQTAALFLRTQLLRGEMSLVDYQKAADALLVAMGRDGRLTQVLRQVDRPAFLLRPDPPSDELEGNDLPPPAQSAPRIRAA